MARTAAQAQAELREWIAQTEFRLPTIPAGHPVLAALTEARNVLAWLDDQDDILPPGPLPPRTDAYVSNAIDNLATLSANVTADPTQPLPSTIWPKLRDLPWPWIAVGVAGLLGVAILFQRREA